MRHLKKGRKFGREEGQRAALLKTRGGSLFLRGKTQTTEAKAKELRPYVEKFVPRARRATLADRRALLAALPPVAVKSAFTRAESMKDRPGGYTRITKLGARKGDSARMAVIEFVVSHSMTS